MKMYLYILESRGPKTPLDSAAAIAPEGASTPEGYAVRNKVEIPEGLSKHIEQIFANNNNVITQTRDELLGILAMMGRIGHEAGVELAKQSRDEEEKL